MLTYTQTPIHPRRPYSAASTSPSARLAHRSTRRGEQSGGAPVDAVQLGRPRTVRSATLRPIRTLAHEAPARSGRGLPAPRLRGGLGFSLAGRRSCVLERVAASRASGPSDRALVRVRRAGLLVPAKARRPLAVASRGGACLAHALGPARRRIEQAARRAARALRRSVRPSSARRRRACPRRLGAVLSRVWLLCACRLVW